MRLRWLAITGQSAAVVGAQFGLGLALPFGWCFLVIAASSWLNLALRIRFPASYRLSDDSAALLLAFDIIQLAARSTVAARAMSMGRETWATFPRSAVWPED